MAGFTGSGWVDHRELLHSISGIYPCDSTESRELLFKALGMGRLEYLRAQQRSIAVSAPALEQAPGLLENQQAR
jgi:hypothetical protein